MRSSNTKSLTAAVATGRQEVERARAILAEWEAASTAASAELASLEARSGTEVLDDPAAATRLPRVMQELRDQVDIASRAATAQRPRVVEAERHYLAAEADLAEVPLAEARAALEVHQRRTRELLAALEAHDGRYVPEVDLLEARHQAGSGPASWDMPKSAALAAQVARLERPVQILREMAAGRDPGPLLAQWGMAPEAGYPAVVWGPDALVRPTRYDGIQQSRRAAMAALETATIPGLEQRVMDAQAELEQAEQQAQDRARHHAMARARQKLEGAQGELARAEAEAAELRGRLEHA